MKRKVSYGDNVSMWGEPYFPMKKSTVKRGFYKHYKGGVYFVLGTGKHSETQEELVVYYSLHYFCFWARPAEMWNDTVEVGETQRFKKISIWQAVGLLNKKPH